MPHELSKGACMAASSESVTTVPPNPSSMSRDGRPFLWLISLSCVALMGAYVASHPEAIQSDLPDLLIWIPALALIHMLPVTAWRYAPFISDLPLTVLATLVLTPPQVAVVVFV